MKKLSSDNKWLSSNFLNLKKKNYSIILLLTVLRIMFWKFDETQNQEMKSFKHNQDAFNIAFRQKMAWQIFLVEFFSCVNVGKLKNLSIIDFTWNQSTNQRYENLPLSNTTSESLKFEFDRFVQNLGLKLSKFKEFATKIIPFLSFFFFFANLAVKLKNRKIF